MNNQKGDTNPGGNHWGKPTLSSFLESVRNWPPVAIFFFIGAVCTTIYYILKIYEANTWLILFLVFVLSLGWTVYTFWAKKSTLLDPNVILPKFTPRDRVFSIVATLVVLGILLLASLNQPPPQTIPAPFVKNFSSLGISPDGSYNLLVTFEGADPLPGYSYKIQVALNEAFSPDQLLVRRGEVDWERRQTAIGFKTKPNVSIVYFRTIVVNSSGNEIAYGEKHRISIREENSP